MRTVIRSGPWWRRFALGCLAVLTVVVSSVVALPSAQAASFPTGDCLTLAATAYDIYMSIDDSLRRICNQAFFSKLYITEKGNADLIPGDPFNVLFHPQVQMEALGWQRGEYDTTKLTDKQLGHVLNNEPWVVPSGLEPVASTLSR